MKGAAMRDERSAPLDAEDWEILAGVPAALENGLELLRWSKEAERTGGYVDRFELTTTFHRPDYGYSFFGLPTLQGSPYPVMGDLTSQFYDRPKTGGSPAAAAEWMNDQVREFALRYFLRVSDTRPPEVLPRGPKVPLPPWLRPLSWCPEGTVERKGFGYEQLYYKLRSGAVGKFPAHQRSRIVDLRQIGEKYEWIVVLVRIFDFDLPFEPFGPGFPSIDVPLREQQLAVISREFVADRDRPEPGVLGEYGPGYAVLRNPAAEGVLAYGPGRFENGFQLFRFRVLENGEARVRLSFTVNRPRKILNLSLDPLDWGFQIGDLLSDGQTSRLLAPLQEALDLRPWRGTGFDPVLGSIALLNLATGGLAARELCISREQLEKDMLVMHFLQNYDLIVGSLLTWRQIPNWLDRSALPDWVVSGITS